MATLEQKARTETAIAVAKAPRRAEMLYKASEILIARKEEYAQLMTPGSIEGDVKRKYFTLGGREG